LEHIVPRIKGGKDTFDNLTTSCEECNLGIGRCLLEERNKYKKGEEIDKTT